MRGDEIEELDDACGIDAFVTAKACRYRALRIAQIDQRYRKLILLQLLVGEAFDRGLRSVD